jgi:hypothetical protein
LPMVRSMSATDVGDRCRPAPEAVGPFEVGHDDDLGLVAGDGGQPTALGARTNPLDYDIVKRGSYDVASFFILTGIYGRIQWRSCRCYVIPLAVQVPFLDQASYAGPLVKPRGGADISWIVGFVVATVRYLAGVKRAGARQGCPR